MYVGFRGMEEERGKRDDEKVFDVLFSMLFFADRTSKRNDVDGETNSPSSLSRPGSQIKLKSQLMTLRAIGLSCFRERTKVGQKKRVGGC